MVNIKIYLLHQLKISRPGLWFPTIWIYLVPFTFENEFWKSLVFWSGFLFVTFPLNYLVYGFNDLHDVKADSFNKRKGNFLFGARSNYKQLSGLTLNIVKVVLPYIVFFSILRGWKMLLLLGFMIAINVVYNVRPYRLKERPPFEIVIQIGYVFTAFFSILLNDLDMIPWQTIVYLCLFAFQAHIAGEIMDIEPDRLGGKKTTATVIGRTRSKLLMLSLLIAEIYILVFWFDDFMLAGFLGVFSLWLIVDLLFLFRDKPYTVFQMKLFGIAMNISAILSMLWILYTGKLLHPNF